MPLLLLPLACGDPDWPRRCEALPEPDACPVSSDAGCDDRSCSALYACRQGEWELVERCSAFQGGAGGGAGEGGSGGAAGEAGASGAAGEASSCRSVSPSTCPALQRPDCDAAFAEACPAEACALGCEGFLRCEGGDWSESYVAYCDENGELFWSP